MRRSPPRCPAQGAFGSLLFEARRICWWAPAADRRSRSAMATEMYLGSDAMRSRPLRFHQLSRRRHGWCAGDGPQLMTRRAGGVARGAKIQCLRLLVDKGTTAISCGRRSREPEVVPYPRPLYRHGGPTDRAARAGFDFATSAETIPASGTAYYAGLVANTGSSASAAAGGDRRSHRVPLCESLDPATGGLVRNRENRDTAGTCSARDRAARSLGSSTWRPRPSRARATVVMPTLAARDRRRLHQGSPASSPRSRSGDRGRAAAGVPARKTRQLVRALTSPAPHAARSRLDRPSRSWRATSRKAATRYLRRAPAFRPARRRA